MADIVARTDQVSPSFIKELMRRAAQQLVESNGSPALRREHAAMALDEMLFTGGSLNLKLLGAEERSQAVIGAADASAGGAAQH